MNGSGSSVISKPTGGGALQGIGEKFSPDLFTGTGNFSVPITLPPGRNGLQPQLNLQYSTGNGNSPFGLGWGISVPGISRKTSKGVPIYKDEEDVFILSGAEDLIPVERGSNYVRYQPRTEGIFAKILHFKDSTNDYWKVMTKDGLVSYYGTPNSFEVDQAVVADPKNPSKIFSWQLSKTEDPFGNHIVYSYHRDRAQVDNRHWDQIYLDTIKYIDHGDPGNPQYLASVSFNYQEREDAFSSFRQGFEIRTTQRCTSIDVFTHDSPNTLIRKYDLVYLDERVKDNQLPTSELPLNGISFLSQVKVTGYKNGEEESMPPLSFAYSQFQPDENNLFPVSGKDLPPGSLGRPEYELADLFGNGLPDIFEMAGGVVRYWRNLGNGQFDLPRSMENAPAGFHLGQPEVHLMDANGDAKVDLVVQSNGTSGYFPIAFGGGWDRQSFKKYTQSPSFSLQDPEVQLVDLDGDGITDAIRSGNRLECFFHDAEEGWNTSRQIGRKQYDDFPDVNFSDPRVRWADMSGDGLQDIAVVHDRNVEYWANMGHGDFSKRINMRNSPRLPRRYDPNRLLLGDVDGDGLADIIYVENNKITLWLNQSGNAWSPPIEITGTPAVTDMDAVRLVDLLGTGIAGILWSRDKGRLQRHQMYFLDFSKGIKPYLLKETNNHMGAVTKVEYRSSIEHYLRDESSPATRWKTTLPFPVQTVSCVEVIDQISNGKMATEYHYHHGYWDGAEREFRGFGGVDQRDTETFDNFNTNGLHGDQDFNAVTANYYSPPIETRTWFHLGAIGDERGDWTSPEFTNEYWSGDINVFPPLTDLEQLLKSIPRRAKRDAYRALRGSILRTELYALDGTARENFPYTITEGQFNVRLEYAPIEEAVSGKHHIFFPFATAQRTTQWERGNDPMTQLAFTSDYDEYGQAKSQLSVGIPRGRDYTQTDFGASKPYLITFNATTYCFPKDEPNQFMVDRVARTSSYEIINNGRSAIFDLVQDVFAGNAQYHLIGQNLSFYDGAAFTGLPFQEIGNYGLAVRTETLILTPAILTEAYGTSIPVPLQATPSWTTDYPIAFQNAHHARLGYRYHTNSEAGFSTGYYVVSGRTQFDFQTGVTQPRGLALATRDPFDQETTIQYDNYQLLPEKVVDPQGMEVAAEYDYDSMQVKKMTDPNGNESAFAFSPLGLLQKVAVMGKSGEGKGDTLDDPGVEYQYDFFAFENNSDPVWVKTIQRENHILDNINDDTLQTVEYSDGFGRLVQTRIQTDDVIFGNTLFGDAGLPADQTLPNAPAVGIARNPGDLLNVIVSGWQVYNNKGWVVEKHEPFYGQGWDYDPLSTGQGQKVIMHYDPRGNAIRTLNPDGTEQRVIYGHVPTLSNPDSYEPSPWENFTYDANDLAPITHPTDSSVPATHYFTPNSNELDALGRTIKTTNHQVQAVGGGTMEDVVMQYEYDIRGNLLRVLDPYGRTAFSHVYDLKPKAGEDDPGANILQTTHLDGGTKTVVFDGIGNPVEMRDSKGALILNAYDNLNRLVHNWASDKTGEATTLRQVVVYGDNAGLTNPANDNLLGKPYKTYDEAGLITLPRYDFKGSPIEKSRRVIKDSELQTATIGQSYRVDWTASDLGMREGQLLENRVYATDLVYDALGRTTRMTYPLDEDGERKSLLPTYNRAGALQRIELQNASGTTIQQFVQHIAYSAKGQRLMVAYGNRIMSRYVYDEKTFRLTRMRSEKYQQSGWTFSPQSGSNRQDCAYQYDLNGNIVATKDQTPNSGISPNPNELLRQFTYDPLNRLLSATGRESDIGSTAYPWEDGPIHNDYNQIRFYTRYYSFDKLGNVQSLQHVNPTGSGNFTRSFQYTPGQNTLKNIQTGGNIYAFQYDINGNQIQENNSRFFEWDAADQLRTFYVNDGTTTSIHAQYLYDATGNRVKKIVQDQSGKTEVTVYIDGIFDHNYIITGSSVQENNTLHVLDDRILIATIRVGIVLDVNEPPQTIKYNLEDHLGNATATLNDNGSWISREEYFSYGETSFGTFANKKYRFVGKELDGESGLYYYGARYYSAWTCRFVSIDPLFREYPFYTPYQYAGNKPINLIDLDGFKEGNKEDFAPTTHASGSINGNEYTVVNNKESFDTLFSVAKRFGTSVDKLKDINNLKSNNLKNGQKLIIPKDSKYGKSINSIELLSSKELRDSFDLTLEVFSLYIQVSTLDPGKNSNSSEPKTLLELATAVKNSPNIKFGTEHPSPSSGYSKDDDANAIDNINDAADGKDVKTSPYGHAKGAETPLDSALLRGLYDLSKEYSFSVTELAGAKHGSNSRHYVGSAVDIGSINGQKVNINNKYFKDFVKRAKELGATERLYPGKPGHSGHIHLGWPRPK